jgi:hypothetical protein
MYSFFKLACEDTEQERLYNDIPTASALAAVLQVTTKYINFPNDLFTFHQFVETCAAYPNAKAQLTEVILSALDPTNVDVLLFAIKNSANDENTDYIDEMGFIFRSITSSVLKQAYLHVNWLAILHPTYKQFRYTLEPVLDSDVWVAVQPFISDIFNGDYESSDYESSDYESSDDSCDNNDESDNNNESDNNDESEDEQSNFYYKKQN